MKLVNISIGKVAVGLGPTDGLSVGFEQLLERIVLCVGRHLEGRGRWRVMKARPG